MKHAGSRHLVSAALIGGLLCGCASHPELQRGWVGGEFENAQVGFFAPDPLKGDTTLPLLPEAVQKEQSGAVLVTGLDDTSPLAQAGIRQGDLIVGIDGEKVTSLDDLRSRVDAMTPGATARLRLFRNGETLERPLVIGRETYKKIGTISVGLRFSPEIELKMAPDFSLFSLVSFRSSDRRISLRSPQAVYSAALSAEKKPAENRLWDLWLGIVGLGRSEAIIKQEAMGARHDET